MQFNYMVILYIFVSHHWHNNIKQIKNRAQPLDKSEKYDIIDSVTRRRQTSHLIQRKKVIQKNIKNKK